MLAVIILFTVGFLAGLLLKRWIRSTKPIERLVTIAIWLLIFILGANVGFNRVVMGNLHTLGLWALIIAVGSVAGSIAVVALVQRYIYKGRG
ncbi:LysO family transporter [uncultured Acetobacteroides sp.]|uniref:LysO family transporter n=1 Tax=uncultured Acetobacteroides sp. TaxID=1760811 RepID=UPI0029F50FE1|nr:LysO family transporter [uncultured Acetobacteroides sp.]